MKKQYIMGVDIGTSSAKAIVMHVDGTILSEAQAHYTIEEPSPGYRVQDAALVLKAILETMEKAYVSIPARDELAGISFSSAMHSLMVVDEQGAPLTPLLLWADTRSVEQALYIKQEAHARELYWNTGVPVHPMTPLCKIMWLRQQQPDVFTRAYKFISIKEYLFYHLTGLYVIDHSLASATGLFNIHTLQWYPLALQLAGISPGQLSQPVPVFQQFRLAAPNPMIKLSIDVSVPLVIGSSDGCLANIGSGVQQQGDVAVTISTSMAVRITSDTPHPDEGQSIFNYCISADKYVCGGGSNNGSLLLHWMAMTLLQNPALADPEKFMAKALTAPAGCEGLVFLPYLLGERAPVWDANATGVITGFQFHHQQQHLMRSLVEGLTMNAYIIIEKLIHVTGKITAIKASGGFTNSHAWVQMLADTSNLPVTIENKADASAIGAVIVGGYSLGIYDSLQVPHLTQADTITFYPNKELHKVYQKNLRVFRKLYKINHQ